MREPEVPTEAQWRHEQKRAVAERAHDSEAELGRMTNDAAVNNANIALRTLVVINGGAAVAILAFISSLLPRLEDAVGLSVAELAMPLVWFAWGVALASIGTMLAYLTNYSVHKTSVSRSRHFEYPHVRETPSSRRWWWAAAIFQVLAFGSAIASLIVFIVGMYAVRASILSVVL